MAANNGSHRAKISSEVEDQLQIHSEVLNRAKTMLQEQELHDNLFDEVVAAAVASIRSHHPDDETLCSDCMRLHILVHRL